MGKTFLFIFPVIPGHINPSLAIARQLIQKGHKVHYICRDFMKAPIEAVGATFHSDTEVYKTMCSNGREFDQMGFGVAPSLTKELGIEDHGFLRTTFALYWIHVDLKLKDLVPFTKDLKPDAVVYCPMLNGEGGFVANFLGIPSYSLTTVAGPGSLVLAYTALAGAEGYNVEGFLKWMEESKLIQDSKKVCNETWKADIPEFPEFGALLMARYSTNFVTTIDDLMEPCSPSLQKYYDEYKTTFIGVGPCTDVAGAERAVAMIEKADDKANAANTSDTLAKVRLAKKAGRQVIVVSLGTMITGNTELGWKARQKGPDGNERGLSGEQLCQTAWAGVFDAVGTVCEIAGPLIVVSVGAQPNALGSVKPPPNAVCQQSIQQVDILNEEPDLFVFGGGQNGFMEALANGTPLLCLPALGDQVVTGMKVPAMGLGLTVDRPDCDGGKEEETMAKYRKDVSEALRKVLSTAYDSDSFKAKAGKFKEGFAKAGGVMQVVDIIEGKM